MAVLGQKLVELGNFFLLRSDDGFVLNALGSILDGNQHSTRLPRGVVDLAANIPPDDVRLVGIIVAVMLPLSRILSPLYTFRVRSRIFRWYAQLRDIEQRIDSQDSHALLQELRDLESLAEKVTVPLSYTDELYALRSNIALVRKNLLRAKAPTPTPTR